MIIYSEGGEGNNLRSVHYSGTQEVLDADVAEGNMEHAKDSLHKKYDQRTHASKEWFGVAGGSTALLKFVETGWEEGVKRVEQAMGSLKVPSMSHLRPRLLRGDHGDELDMRDVYSGDLEMAWTRLQRSPTKPDTRYCIAVDICGSSNEDSSELFWPGAAAFAVASALIEARKPVRIICYLCTNHSYVPGPGVPGELFIAIDLKAYRQLLTPDKIALSALSGYFRSIGFKAMFAQPYSIKGSMGRPRHLTDEEVRSRLFLQRNEKLMNISGVRGKEASQNAVNRFLDENFDLNIEDAI